ncbi:AIPR family protein [Dyadobacter sediminis]|uniref:Abortive phage resistance protein n=1 Tax=Dyadobacter sediminis TaxID=1493691 RepID=A0A5R9K697_9BACT|nr:AIPR family protein [Dyadobacter sediminis]TLU89315.1 abortive phage resistance protein [Dyadobacter sediminis]GGC06533.1 putative abortive infection phage resistance protein [Dyadobacter sediminis]
MSSLSNSHLDLLKAELKYAFVPHLPPLLEEKPQDQQEGKNLSRAFSAFALASICEISPELACKSVVDDFGDNGIDAIFYHAQQDTLYLVQSKLKASEMFKQEDAMSFCQGVQKLMRQDIEAFNKHVKDRQSEIEQVIDNCNAIKLIIAYVGEGISNPAINVLNDLFDQEKFLDERLVRPFIKFDAAQVYNNLLDRKALPKINVDLKISSYGSVQFPKITFFGLIPLIALVKLHNDYESSLYEKNIRSFLGQKTDVNIAIRNTLFETPLDFLYFHNGVAALCDEIKTKSARNNEKNLRIRGLSIINGAQTIASAAQFLKDHPEADITAAKVFITLIKSSSDSEFGKKVTKARNHQNSVAIYNFAALDDIQERLRKELAFLKYTYIYKAGIYEGVTDVAYLHINEAASALALFSTDPRFVITLKREPSILLNIDSEQYKHIFSSVTSQQIIDAVCFLRYIQVRINSEVSSSQNPHDRLIYKHGAFAIGWILAKQIFQQQAGHAIMDGSKLEAQLSVPFDELRQVFLDETKKQLLYKGPLAFFKSQTDVIPLLITVLIKHFKLGDDQIIKKKTQRPGQPYQMDLFDYLIKKAPQIGNLT